MNTSQFNKTLDLIKSDMIKKQKEDIHQHPSQQYQDYIFDQIKITAKKLEQQVETSRVRQPYWNETQDRAVFNETLKNVYHMLDIAAEYDGVVFGGFVRNVLVPKAFDKPIIGYKDVDLWFKAQKQADEFVAAVGDKFAPYKWFDCNSSDYPFTRTQYVLGKTDTNPGILVDVVVKDTLPVDDLNVNQLTYSAKDGYKSYSNDSTHELMDSILQKKAIILPSYSLRCDLTGNFHIRWMTQDFRLKQFRNRGWVLISQ